MREDAPGDPAAEIEARRAAGDVPGLVACLDASQPVARRRLALEALLTLASPEALDALGALLVQPATAISEPLLSGLAARPGVDFARLLSRGLGADDPIWRSRILDALATRTEPEALTLLLPATRDRSGAVRSSALRHVRRILQAAPERLAALPPAALDAALRLFETRELLPWLERGPAGVRIGAARILAAEGNEAAFRALAQAARNEDDDGAAARMILAGSPAPAGYFAELARHPAADVRRVAIEALAGRAGEEAIGLLVDALADTDVRARLTALAGLRGRMTEPALHRAITFLDDADAGVRLAAVEAIAAEPHAACAAALERAARDSDEEVCASAVLALARRGVVQAAQGALYARVLSQRCARARLAPADIDALCVLAQCLGAAEFAEDSETAPSLIAAGRCSATRLRRAAVDALLKRVLDIRIPALGELAETHDRVILKTVALALGEAGVPEALVPLIRAVDEVGGRTADRAREYLERFAQIRELETLLLLLRGTWASVRRFAAERLRDLGDERAIAPLCEAMGDEDVEVQLAAVTALGRFADRPAVSERLIAAIDFGDLGVRQTAVEALGTARVQAAVPALIRALANPFLRLRAEGALREIGDRKGAIAVRRRRLREKLFKKKETPGERARRESAERGRVKKGGK